MRDSCRHGSYVTPSSLIPMALDTVMRINRDEFVQIEKMSCIFAGILVIDIAAEIILENRFH